LQELAERDAGAGRCVASGPACPARHAKATVPFSRPQRNLEVGNLVTVTYRLAPTPQWEL